MFFLDIDGTIALPADEPLPREWERLGFTVRDVGFSELAIANFVLAGLRKMDDIHMLSTWGTFAYKIPEAFEFSAQVLDYRDFSNGLVGIEAKFSVVQAFRGEVRAWADDHLTAHHLAYAASEGFLAVAPQPHQCLTEGDMALLSPARGSFVESEII